MPVFKTKFALSVLSLCALSACMAPNFFPDGYVYHDKPYKSQTPAPSMKFTELQRKTMGPEQADQFRLSIYQLVENLTRRAGMPPKSIYVMKPEPMTPFYANLDNDLRESMRHIGYTLTDKPEGAYVFTYSASVLKKKAPPQEGDVSPNVHIALQVFDGVGEGSKMLTIEEGDFYIKGAETLAVPFAIFPGVKEAIGVTIPEPSGPAEDFN